MAIQERSSLVRLALDPTTVTGGISSKGIVTLDNRTGSNSVVKLTSSDSVVAEVPLVVLVPLLQTSTAFEVKTKPVAQPTSVDITATFEGVSRKAALRVDPPVLTSVSVNPARVEGEQSSTGTVTLSGQAPASGLTVALSSSDEGVATVPASVDVPHLKESKTFTITTQSVDQDTPVDITATFGVVSLQARLTVEVDKEEEKGRSKEGKEDKEVFEVSEEPMPLMTGSSTPPENRLPRGQPFIRQEERPAVGKGLL